MFRKALKKLSRFNLILLSLVLLVTFTSIYFVYKREKAREYLYATLLIGPYPYWQENAVSVGDRDQSAFGVVNAVVEDKESFEAGGNGKTSIILVRINIIEDRSGILLYKNKPIAIGSSIQLRLPLVDLQGTIVNLNGQKPKYEDKKLRVTFKNKGYEPEHLRNLKVGDEVISSKGRVVVKIVNFKISPHETRSDTAAGRAVVTYDPLRRDLDLTADVLVNQIDSDFYYLFNKKVKVGESLDFIFNDYNLWGLSIVAITPIE